MGVPSLEGADISTFLAPAAMCLRALGIVQEQAGGFDHDIGTDFVPLQVGRVRSCGQADGSCR